MAGSLRLVGGIALDGIEFAESQAALKSTTQFGAGSESASETHRKSSPSGSELAQAVAEVKGDCGLIATHFLQVHHSAD